MPRNLVLFDLEWNIGYQPYTFNYHGVQQTFRGEIVEIGAVKIDEDANVLDTFSIHLRLYAVVRPGCRICRVGHG